MIFLILLSFNENKFQQMAKDLVNGYVDVEIHNGIATVEFFHPQSNSLPHRIL